MLKKVMKKINIEKFKGIENQSPEWVNIELGNEEYETNRYDFSQEINGITYNMYVYYDEDLTTVYAIDDTVEIDGKFYGFDEVIVSDFKELIEAICLIEMDVNGK